MRKTRSFQITAWVMILVMMLSFIAFPDSAKAAPKQGTVDPQYNNALYIKVETTGGRLTYTGGVRHPGVEVTLQNMTPTSLNRTLKEGRDYEIIDYQNDVNAYEFDNGQPSAPNPPTVRVRVYFSDGSSQDYEAFYEILKASIQDAKLSQTTFKVAQNGSTPAPVPTVTVNKRTLSENVDFTVLYKNIAAGSSWTTWSSAMAKGWYIIRLEGMGNYTDINQTARVQIVDEAFGTNDLGNAKIIFNKKSRTFYYNPNKAIKPSITVKYGKKKLKKGKHYTVQYSANTAAGTARVSVVAISGSGYTGFTEADFTILPLPISKCKVRGVQDQMFFPAAAASSNGIMLPDLKVTYGGTTLANGTDYFVTYTGNTSAGKATVVLDADAGTGNYTGTIKKHYQVTRRKLKVKKADITMHYTDGSPIADVTQIDADRGEQPVVVGIVDHTTGWALAEGKDYTVSYSNFRAKYRDTKFKKAKPPTIKLKGIGDYSFTYTIHYLMK